MQFEADNCAGYTGKISTLKNTALIKKSNHFDDRMDELLGIAEDLILTRGVFHLGLHFSSSQIKCSTFDNPYSFQLYTADDVFLGDFLGRFAKVDIKRHTKIKAQHVRPVLAALKWLRSKRNGSELRNASLHMVNGYIGLSFACDDTRYINFHELIMHI